MHIQDLWKYYGDELVFQGVTATIGLKDRIGLVGPNGAGKTTLLKTMVGELAPDRGQISLRGGFTQGYLWQTLPSNPMTLTEFVSEPFQGQIQLEERLRSLEQEMARQTGQDLTETMDQYARTQERFEHGGGYHYLVEINEVVTGLGFAESDLQRDLTSFSGGEQMRVSLARLLLGKPSLLVLDEPTNHLDMEAMDWLEDFLNSYPLAFIVVSHDRYFLDKVAERIWELEGHALYQYKGNYSAYLPQRQLRQSQLEASIERQEQERARLEFFIQKFGAGTRARQAKSKEKQLARLPNLEQLNHDPSIAFRFEAKRQSGHNIVLLEDIAHAYGSDVILKGVNAEIKRGDRIALLGPNGSGKSTLLKILTGELKGQGRLAWGTGIDLGYFSQHITFHPTNTVLEELYDEHPLDLGVLRSVLARFLFRGEDVFKETSVLSGGEKNRLALAKLLLHRPNVLLLDEPTNHLDIYAREALEQALEEFDGTIVFVSHDRYFIEKLATKIWYLDDGFLEEFIGGYALFSEERRQKQVSVEKKTSPKRETSKPEQAKRSRRKLAAEIERVEAAIFVLEEQVEELEALLASPELYEDQTKSVLAIDEYREIKEKLQSKYERWANLAAEQEEG